MLEETAFRWFNPSQHQVPGSWSLILQHQQDQGETWKDKS